MTKARTRTAEEAPLWLVASVYYAFIVAAEILISIPGPGSPLSFPFQAYGFTLHVVVLCALLVHSVLVMLRDRIRAYFLISLSLAPIIRLLSLSTPRSDFTDLQWLAIISVPLLGAVGVVAYSQGLRPKDIGLAPHLRDLGPQTAIALTGIPLGFVEYEILQPAPWSTAGLLGGVTAGIVILFFATGLAEELIFRGVMLKRAVEGLGASGGLVFVTLVFASLHIFYLNAYDFLFVLTVGFFYGLVVLRTGSLWGAIVSHTLDNVVLYLVATSLLALLH